MISRGGCLASSGENKFIDRTNQVEKNTIHLTSKITEYSLLTWQQILKEVYLGKGKYLDSLFNLKGLTLKHDKRQFLDELKMAFETVERPDQLASIVENYPAKNQETSKKGDLRAFLYFVGPFSGSPSSVFGHIFIVFDDKSPGPFSEAYGYSALINKDHNNQSFFKYLYKGLTGGYKGIVSKDELYMFWRKYSALEDREIYLYEVNSKKYPVENLYQSLQDPGKYSRAYYFRNDNCATFIRRLFYGLATPTPFEEYPYSIIQKLLVAEKIHLIKHFPTRAEILSQKDKKSFDYQNALYDLKASKLARVTELRIMAKKLASIKQEKIKLKLRKNKKQFVNSHDPHRISGWYGKDARIGFSYRHFFQGLHDPKVFAEYRDFLEFGEIQFERFKSLYLKKFKLLNLTTNRKFSFANKKFSYRFDILYDHYRYQSFQTRRGRIRTGLGVYKNFSFFEFGAFTGPSIGLCDRDFCAPVLTQVFFKIGEYSPLSLTFNLEWEYIPWKDDNRELVNYEMSANIKYNSSIYFLIQYQKTSIEKKAASLGDNQWFGQINHYF